MRKNGKNSSSIDSRILTAGILLVAGIIAQQAVKGVKKFNSWDFDFDMKF